MRDMVLQCVLLGEHLNFEQDVNDNEAASFQYLGEDEGSSADNTCMFAERGFTHQNLFRLPLKPVLIEVLLGDIDVEVRGSCEASSNDDEIRGEDICVGYERCTEIATELPVDTPGVLISFESLSVDCFRDESIRAIWIFSSSRSFLWHDSFRDTEAICDTCNSSYGYDGLHTPSISADAGIPIRFEGQMPQLSDRIATDPAYFSIDTEPDTDPCSDSHVHKPEGTVFITK